MEARAPPSKILFIRDIPATMSNEQFEDLFSTLNGYVSIRRKPFFAFVEFKDSGYATSAMRRYSGYRHHSLDKPLSIDFDKDPRSRDDFSQTSSTTTSSSYRDVDSRGVGGSSADRDRDHDSGRREHRSDYRDHRDHESPRDRKDRDDDRHPDRDDDYDDTADRSDKHRKREVEPESHHDVDKKRPREMDRFEKDRSRYRDAYLDREDYPPTKHHLQPQPPRDFEPFHHLYPREPMQYYMPQSRIPDACTTLFVSNLPKDVTERELSILFRFMRGFVSVRLVHRDGKYPICFCDFRDVPSAAMAMEILNGFRMDPKDMSSSISIEFDKSRTRHP
ncbi:hypothetical protein SAMD00019534_035040, partial [Acytostelium subglobosum LB1]|uniref:hypothetical protein n=1 Tax=Acytostelium subglobosum LB1 TaxID=1410327 RepID=UPI0006450842